MERRFAFGLVLAIATGSAGGATVEQQRLAYKAAYAAASRGQEAIFRVLSAPLADYPLYPYLLYADLRHRIEDAEVAEVHAFLDAYATLPIARRLRAEWLETLGKREDWDQLLADYDPAVADDGLRCYHLRAKLAGGDDVVFDATNQDLWYQGRSQPEACDPLFRHWREQGVLDDGAYLRRARLAVRAGNLNLARYLGRRLDRTGRLAVHAWADLFADPERQLPQTASWREPAADTQLIAEALARLARREPGAAVAVWPRVQRQFEDHPDLAEWVQREIALYRATDYTEDAAERLDALPPGAIDQQILEWRTRVAMVEQDWATVLSTIDRMRPPHSHASRWRYWLARALEATGQNDAAQAIDQELADETSYYGFLAADRLGTAYALCPDPSAPDASAARGIADDPRIVRSLELFHVDQPVHARREWRDAMEEYDESQRLAAALRAADAGWHHQAILTLGELEAFKRYESRFPVAWPEQVAAGAAAHNLPDSLILGVMRSESALAADAVSHAGARGLMQLTLETARNVARRYSLSTPSVWSLLEPHRNIQLGAAYLDQLFERFAHPLLVLAAYNAGPDPVQSWLDQGRLPQQAQVWIETLPYHETRDYIPRVLTYQSIYDWRLTGRMTRLSATMIPIDQRPGRTRAADLTVAPECPAGGES